jgi:acyl-coenzyme A synthetase/AMP-(fatty) acid ligase
VPAGVQAMAGPLPRNPNGKIDRKLLSAQWHESQEAPVPQETARAG